MAKKFQMGNYAAYVWKGINRWQQKMSGIIVATDDSTAEKEARNLGVMITSLKKTAVWMLPGKADRGIKIADITYTMRQFTALLAAGIPMSQGLEIIASGAEKAKLKALLLTVRDDVAAGRSLSQSFSNYPDYFDDLICGLIQAGEQSGALDRMMSEITHYLERQEYLKNRVKRAMYYPVTIFGICFLVVMGMLLFLVPRFEKIYASFDAKLPAFTLQIMNLSRFVQDYWWFVLLMFVGLYYLFKKLNRSSIIFQRIRDAFLLKVIIFGSLVQKAIIARVCSTLAITLSAGIPLIDAMMRASGVAKNYFYKEALDRAREQVAEGEPVSSAFRQVQLFPGVVVQMIEVGEKSGSLEQMLRKVSEYYADQVDTAVDGLVTLIEPLLIVIVGGLVGVFLIALYLPIFNLGSVIK